MKYLWVGLILALYFSSVLTHAHDSGRAVKLVNHYDDFHTPVPCHIHIYADGERQEWDVTPQIRFFKPEPEKLSEPIEIEPEPEPEPEPESTETPKILNPCRQGTLEIIAVQEEKKPRRLKVIVRNTSGSFIRFVLPCWQIELYREGQRIVNANLRKKFGEMIITPQRSRGEPYPDTTFYLLPKRRFHEVQDKDARFMIHFQYFYGKQTGYAESDVLKIKYEGEIIAEYPRPAAMSPRAFQTLTTSWAAIKFQD